MTTEELIRVIAADGQRTRSAGGVLPPVIGLSALAAGLLFYSFVDMRSDLGSALGQARVLAKQCLPVLLALAAFGAVLRLATPGRRVAAWAPALAVAPALAAFAFAATAAALPPAAWSAEVAGHSRAACLTLIPLIAVPILSGALWALSRGASTRPTLSGWLAGILAGGCAATVYAFYCTDDSAMFWAVWYSTAILIVSAIGALLGRHVLRW